MDTSTASDNVQFIHAGPTEDKTHHGHSHSHATHQHGHTHEHMNSPGSFKFRERSVVRNDWNVRSFTVGIGGPVGSGKTAVVLALCQYMRNKHNMCVVTNDIFTREDYEFLVRNAALPMERMKAVETGGCPHAAIREDYSQNIEEVRQLTRRFQPDFVLLESGGDNLAANFSRQLADFIIYVIDVSGGDKIPRKGGPGITQSDLLIINKTDLAAAVGSDLDVMLRDANQMRDGGPVIFAQAKHGIGIPEIARHIINARAECVGPSVGSMSV